MTDWDQLSEIAPEYNDVAGRLADVHRRVEDQLREDVEAGWLSPRQADVILAGIVACDDEHANWPWKRWKEARRIRDHAADDPPEWPGAIGLADRLDEYFADLDS